ncbi:MAG: iron complex transport system permease protein [Archaeoglobi archaeon]|nr:iron complex transport system permease protein [Archaeoglobi archaeon]MDK2782222.1 iron complex transport system permease protein [Archaeoglobi archaeon]
MSMEFIHSFRKSLDSPKYKLGLILLPLLLFLIYMSLGKYSVSLTELPSTLFEDSMERAILLNVRLPRAIEAMLFGACMGISGAALQTTLRNPLVSPYILGISSGAAFGAALSIALLGSGYFFLTQPSAIIFALIAISLTLSMAKFRGQFSPVSLVLAGVIVSALFSGLLSLIQILVEPEKTQTIVAWMIGRLHTITWGDVFTSFPLTVLGIIGLLIYRWRIFLLSMGDEEARTLGVDVERERMLVILFASIATASVVSVCGIIGWVCLISPHITRFLVGSDPKVLLPASISVGASFMLLADLISRTVWVFEIPVGIITTLVGAPMFLYLMRRAMHEWG